MERKATVTTATVQSKEQKSRRTARRKVTSPRKVAYFNNTTNIIHFTWKWTGCWNKVKETEYN